MERVGRLEAGIADFARADFARADFAHADFAKNPPLRDTYALARANQSTELVSID